MPDAGSGAPSPRPAPVRGYALGPDDWVPGRNREVKCSHGSTGGSLALYRSVVDGQGPPPHRHVHEDETIVVLDGTIQAECGDDTWTGGPGTTFFLPRGLTHTFRSVDGAAEILFIVTSMASSVVRIRLACAPVSRVTVPPAGPEAFGCHRLHGSRPTDPEQATGRHGAVRSVEWAST